MWNEINERETANNTVRIGVGTSSADLSVEQLQAAMARGRVERAKAIASAGSWTFGWLARLFGRRQAAPVTIARTAGAAC